MPGLLKGGTGEVGQVGFPIPGGDTVKVAVLQLLAGHHGLFGEDGPPAQCRAGEAGAGMSSGHRVVPRRQTAQGLASKAPAKLAFPRPFSDDCSPK